MALKMDLTYTCTYMYINLCRAELVRIYSCMCCNLVTYMYYMYIVYIAKEYEHFSKKCLFVCTIEATCKF